MLDQNPPPAYRRYWSYRAFSWLFLGLSTLLFLATVLLLLVQFYILPQIQSAFEEIAHEIYTKHGISIKAKYVNASLVNLNPHLFVQGLTIRITSHTKPIVIENIKTELDWSIIFLRGLSLSLLSVEGLQISLTRDAQGKITWTDTVPTISENHENPNHPVSNLIRTPSKDERSSKTEFDADETTVFEALEWIMSQRAVFIQNANIFWHDERFHTPTQNWHIQGQLHIEKKRSITSILAELSPPASVANTIRLDARFQRFSAIRWQENIGQASLSVKQANWTELSYFLPENQRVFGKTDFTLWMDSKGIKDTRLIMTLQTQNLQWKRLPWKVRSANGTIFARLRNNIIHIDTRRFILRTKNGRFPLPTRADLWLSKKYLNHQKNLKASKDKPLPFEKVDLLIPTITLSEIQKKLLKSIAQAIPKAIPKAEKLKQLELTGKLLNNRITWQSGTQANIENRWQIVSQLDHVSWQALGNIPGVSNLSAQLHLTPSLGNLHFNTKRLELNVPNIMYQPKHSFKKLTGKVSWKYKTHDNYLLSFENIAFSNSDGKINLNGKFHQQDSIPNIDLYATLSNAKARHAWRYMPKIADQEMVQWLKSSITDGAAPLTTLILHGDMRQFPFKKTPLVPKKHHNVFQVHVPFHKTQLKFHPDWPSVKDAAGLLTFNGPSMDIFVTRGLISGAKAEGTQISIPKLEKPNLEINGTIYGTPNQFKDFMLHSPLANTIPRLAEATATGSTQLKLQLFLPLEKNIDDYHVTGDITSQLSSLSISPHLPSLTSLNIVTRFDQEGLLFIEGQGLLFDTPIQFTPTHQRAKINIALPSIDDTTLKKWIPNHPLLDTLQGNASAIGTLNLDMQKVSMNLELDTTDFSSNLPPPFYKPTGINWPLVLKIENSPSNTIQTDSFKLDQSALSQKKRLEYWSLSAALSDRSDDAAIVSHHLLQAFGQWNALKTKLSINIGHDQALPIDSPTPLPETGIDLTINLEHLVMDPWFSHLDAWMNHKLSKQLPINRVDSHIQNLSLFQQNWKNTSATLTPNDNHWQIDIDSPQANGTLVLSSSNQYTSINADFQRVVLSIPSSDDESKKNPDPLRFLTLASSLPAIDLRIHELFLPSSSKLGQLILQGAPTELGYQLTRFHLQDEQHILEGSGVSHDNTQKSQMTLQFHSPNLSDLLSRHLSNAYLSKTELSAKSILEWEGNMFDFSMQSLMGELDLTMKDGSFLEIDPGAARLFSLLSLQSIFRRISFDFSDSIYKGLSFNKITSKLKIHKNELSSQNTIIDASSAKILMYGSLNLSDETQDMELIVLPTISATVASGITFFINPLTGVISWLAQKIVGNPLDHIFAKRLQVTGSWAHPQVKELPYSPLINQSLQQQEQQSKESTTPNQHSDLQDNASDPFDTKSDILTPLNPSESSDAIKTFNRLRPAGFRATCY